MQEASKSVAAAPVAVGLLVLRELWESLEDGQE